MDFTWNLKVHKPITMNSKKICKIYKPIKRESLNF